jgi:hypothetical protein
MQPGSRPIYHCCRLPARVAIHAVLTGPGFGQEVVQPLKSLERVSKTPPERNPEAGEVEEGAIGGE